jgi:hypothetical protein
LSRIVERLFRLSVKMGIDTSYREIAIWRHLGFEKTDAAEFTAAM